MSNTPPANWRHMMSMAAEDGQIIVCSCFYCRKRAVYWAADLLLVYGDVALEDFGRHCACGNSDGTRTRAYPPSPDLVGRVKLSRPAGWTRDWHWASEWLELPVRPLPAMDKPATSMELERRQKPRPAGHGAARFGDPVGSGMRPPGRRR
jgi:hypothetical protein